MRRILLRILALILLLSLGFSVSAAGYCRIDDIGQLDTDEKALLAERAASIADEYSITVCIVTVYSLIGRSPQSYANTYYDYNLLNETNGNGILLVVSVIDRQWAVTTNGETVSVITDSDIDDIMKDVKPQLSKGNYYEAFDAFLTGIEEQYNAKKSEPFVQFLIALVIGAVAGVIVLFFMQSSMKTAVQQHGAGNYLVDSSYDLFLCQDIFLYSHTSKIRKPDNNSSGGRSRSGGSRGGRSGRF